jgi:hypothetical protein
VWWKNTADDARTGREVQRADSDVARFPGSWGGIDWGHAPFDSKSCTYVLSISNIALPEVMVRKPDGSYYIRFPQADP